MNKAGSDCILCGAQVVSTDEYISMPPGILYPVCQLCQDGAPSDSDLIDELTKRISQLRQEQAQ